MGGWLGSWELGLELGVLVLLCLVGEGAEETEEEGMRGTGKVIGEKEEEVQVGEGEEWD